jgi:hypothetical protein
MTLDEMVQLIRNGAKRIDADIHLTNFTSVRYIAKCYAIGENIRIDLEKPEKKE